MRGNSFRTFILVALVVIFLMALHFLPQYSIFGLQPRKINILSQLINLPGDNESIDVIPKPKDPKQIYAHGKNGKLIDFKEIWPKGVQPILDYSEEGAGGMDHFYAMVDSTARHKLKGRPVRVAYYGDSFIEADILVADLRENMQATYGGCGVGWIDAGNDLEQYKRSIQTEFSGMDEHMVMKAQNYNVAEAGIAERYYTTGGSASVTLKATKTFPHAAHWTNSTFYFRPLGQTTVKGKTDANPWLSWTFNESGSLQKTEIPGRAAMAKFTVNGPAILFGAALEGMVVDGSQRGAEVHRGDVSIAKESARAVAALDAGHLVGLAVLLRGLGELDGAGGTGDPGDVGRKIFVVVIKRPCLGLGRRGT